MLSILALALAQSGGAQMATAEADTAALEPACIPPELVGAIPAQGASNVAVDAPFLLLFSGGECGDRIQWVLEDANGTWSDGELAEPEWLSTGRLHRLELDLVPDTTYVLSITPDYTGETVQLAFETGSAAYEPPVVDTLSLDMEVLDVFRASPRLLDALMETRVIAPADTLVRLSIDQGRSTSAAWVADGEQDVRTISLQTDTGEACVYARAEDVRGHAGEWVEVCEAIQAPHDDDDDEEDLEPYTPSRCQSAPAPAAWGLALPFLLLGLRRRR